MNLTAAFVTEQEQYSKTGSSKIQEEPRFAVTEIFGPTIQGEGAVIGQVCFFIRFAGCDSDCSWCDSRHAWDKHDPRFLEMRKFMTATAIRDELRRLSTANMVPMVVLTGGNPALIKNMGRIMDIMPDTLWQVETQGTLYRDWFNRCAWVVISPKLANARLTKPINSMDVAGIIQAIRFNDQAMENPQTYDSETTRVAWYTQISLKIVCFTNEDVTEALNKYYPLRKHVEDFTIQVGTRPDDTPETLTARWFELAEFIKGTCLDLRVLPQTHVLLWGHKIGV